jgi:hypothetical protein
MTSKGLGELFEGDPVDMCARKFLLVSMVGLTEGLACTDLGARTPMGASRNFLSNSHFIPQKNKIMVAMFAWHLQK